MESTGGGGGGYPGNRRRTMMNMRIRRLEKTEVDQPTSEIYDHYQKTRGNVPNMFRTVAHRPEILRTMIAHFRAVMETGTVGQKLKELVIVRTSQINSCEY
jgi:alkylhydroperoxidase family enzyme